MAAAALGLAALSGCAPMLTGQMAGAGYRAASSSLESVWGAPAAESADAQALARQKRMQAVLNSVDVGQDAPAIVQRMGEAPIQKSGNARGFTCYEYAAVYSATEAAVIVAKDGRVVFFGNSRCAAEMADANFRADGKYAGGPEPL